MSYHETAFDDYDAEDEDMEDEDDYDPEDQSLPRFVFYALMIPSQVHANDSCGHPLQQCVFSLLGFLMMSQ